MTLKSLPKAKKRIIKAWAVLSPCGCPHLDVDCYEIYPTREIAVEYIREDGGLDVVVPVEIHLPAVERGKRKQRT